MRESYSITCQHCRQTVFVPDLDSTRTCPKCGHEVGVSPQANYRPALRSPAAKVIAVTILIVLLAVFAIGLVGLLCLR